MCTFKFYFDKHKCEDILKNKSEIRLLVQAD